MPRADTVVGHHKHDEDRHVARKVPRRHASQLQGLDRESPFGHLSALCRLRYDVAAWGASPAPSTTASIDWSADRPRRQRTTAAVHKTTLRAVNQYADDSSRAAASAAPPASVQVNVHSNDPTTEAAKTAGTACVLPRPRPVPASAPPEAAGCPLPRPGRSATPDVPRVPSAARQPSRPVEKWRGAARTRGRARSSSGHPRPHPRAPTTRTGRAETTPRSTPAQSQAPRPEGLPRLPGCCPRKQPGSPAGSGGIHPPTRSSQGRRRSEKQARSHAPNRFGVRRGSRPPGVVSRLPHQQYARAASESRRACCAGRVAHAKPLSPLCTPRVSRLEARVASPERAVSL